MSIELLIEALQLAFTPMNLLLILGGMTIGVFTGALPGISSSMGVVLMLPFTYYMDIVPSIMMLSALYAGSAYGGSITAILFNTPGTAESVATTFDGYPMAQKGEAGKALGLAMTGSAFGGIFSVIIMLLLAPPMSAVALKIQSPEYLGLTLLGIACISSVGTKSLVKSLVTGVFGILLALIGLDPLAGVTRMTFGNIYLMNGIEFIPVMIGSFALAEVLKQAIERQESMDADVKISIDSMNLKEILKYKATMIKSAIIGTVIGILPGTGGSIASIVSYGEAVRSSKDKSQFGKGAPEGILAPETANNAAGGGAMIPTLVLGIPGSPTAAIMLAALVLQGLQPGPQLMKEQPLLLYGVFISMLIASLAVFIAARGAVKIFAAILKFPYQFIAPAILMFSVIGSFSLSNNLSSIWVMILFGFFGYFLKKYHFSGASLVLGLVLGKMMEENLRRTLLLSKGSYAPLFTRPISLVILIFVLLTLFYPFIMAKIEEKKAKSKTA